MPATSPKTPSLVKCYPPKQIRIVRRVIIRKPVVSKCKEIKKLERVTFDTVFGTQYKGVERVGEIKGFEDRKLSKVNPDLAKRLASIINYKPTVVPKEKETFENETPHFLRPSDETKSYYYSKKLWENYGYSEDAPVICLCTPKTSIRDSLKCMLNSTEHRTFTSFENTDCDFHLMEMPERKKKMSNVEVKSEDSGEVKVEIKEEPNDEGLL